MSLPERLGRLHRRDRLGSGGFASVWRYHDDELEADVAVKALADNWAQRLDIRERFLEEARILRRADSDHLVRVYDVGETESGTPYFVMSYADRGTVADLVQDGRGVAPATVVDLLGQAALGLEVLHRHGIVHRDIKPQNLLLRTGHDGVELLVADLGVAKAVAQASGLTAVVGTPAFMAPEQARGTGVDVRADVHALAAVGYLLLTGRHVREDGVAGLVEPRLPPAPSSLVPVPVALDQVLLRGLALEPADRWPDVASFAAALRAAVTPPPPPASPPTRPPAATSTPAGQATAVVPAGGAARTVAWALVVLLVTFALAYGVTLLLR